MPKNTSQPSGVVGGTMDVSRDTTVNPPAVSTGSALARRKAAGRRAKKLAARRKAAGAGRRAR